MHAITYDTFGAARDVLQMQDIANPEPKAGEVCVKLALSGVNPSDVKARAGSRPGVLKPPFPLVIPHSDGAGEIEAVGAGVDPKRIGQRVWVWNGQWQRSHGTAASHITLPAHHAVPLPKEVSFEVGASLGIPGLTACHAVFGGGGVAGETVLIQGGAGTVGLLAVQLAKWGGARVIATCSAKDQDRVLAAGADVTLDYRDPALAARILDANDDTLIETIVEVEFGLNINTDTDVIAPNGRIAAYGSVQQKEPVLPFYPLMFKAVTIDAMLIYLLPTAQREAAIAKLHHALDDGALDCPVEQVFALADTASAHEAVEAGGRSGSILIDCQSNP